MSKELTIKQLVGLILQQAKEKGWGTRPEETNMGEKIALIHSELSEAFNAYRHRNMTEKDGFNEEMADAIIRILHLCGIYDIDIQNEIIKKINLNKNRDWNWDKLKETQEK